MTTTKGATTMERPFDMGGARNYAALPQAAKDAHDFIAWATEQGATRETTHKAWAAAAARHLQATSPDRFANAVAAWKGDPEGTYATLMALADMASRGVTI